MTFPVTSMISVEEARERILSFFSRLAPETRPGLDALRLREPTVGRGRQQRREGTGDGS
mgnify:CR=1 FL=1